MPWTCPTCAATVQDSSSTCPGCQAVKTAWSLNPDKTRNFVIARAKWVLLRGQETTASPLGGRLYDPYALVEAPVARVLRKADLLALLARQEQPASYDVLVVRLFPKDELGDVKLAVDYAARARVEHAFPLAEAPYVDVPFVFVHGPEALPARLALPANVVDLTEESERGFAPELEVTALKKPPVALPTEAASEPPKDVLACSRTSGALFDLGSSFPRPAVAGELRRLEALAQMHPDAELLVFGHADQAGSRLHNKKLSERRAWALTALIQQDPGPWETIQGHADEDWKAAKQAMVSHLGRASFDDTPAGRQELFSAYMASVTRGIDLPADRLRQAPPAYMGCGELNPLGEDAALNRRAELFLVSPGELVDRPCAYADVAPCEAQLAAPGERRTKSFGCAWYDALCQGCPPATEAEPKEVRVYGRDLRALPNATYRLTVEGQAPARGAANKDGFVRRTDLPAQGRCTLEWSDPDAAEAHEYQHRRDLYLGVAQVADAGQAASQRLHNLGYTDDLPFDLRVAAFQEAARTQLVSFDKGVLDEPTAKLLAALHDDTPASLGGQAQGAIGEQVGQGAGAGAAAGAAGGGTAAAPPGKVFVTFESPRFVLSSEPGLHLGSPGKDTPEEQTAFVKGSDPDEDPVDFVLVTDERWKRFLKALPGDQDPGVYGQHSATTAFGPVWVYLYDPGERFVELRLKGSGDWEERVLTEEQVEDGAPFPEAPGRTGAAEQWDVDVSALVDGHAIALPGRVHTPVLRSLFLLEGDDDAEAQEQLLVLTRLTLVDRRRPAVSAQLFDPRCVVASTVEAIAHEVQHLDLGTAQLSFSGVNLTRGAPRDDVEAWPRSASQQRDFRERALLTAITHSIAALEPDTVHRKALGAANRWFLDFGRRKSFLVDGLYNFLQSGPLRLLEACIGRDQEGGLSRGAAAWLGIVQPLGRIAGEHTLVSRYLGDLASTDDSAWTQYVDRFVALSQAEPEEAKEPEEQLKALTDLVSGGLTLTVAAADAHTFGVLQRFMAGGRLASRLAATKETDTFEAELKRLEKTKFWKHFNHSDAKKALGKVKSLHGKVAELLKLKAHFIDGEAKLLSVETLKIALEKSSTHLEALDAKLVWGPLATESKVLAARLSFIGSVISLVEGSQELYTLLRAADYDAAITKGALVTTSTVGLAIALVPIPGARVVGLGLALASAVGELILAHVEDTQTELFLKHCLWGKESVTRGEVPDGTAPWADGAFETWTADRQGVSRQLASLLNVLFRYDVEVTRSTGEIKLEITTQTPPDRFEFVFVGEFTGDGPRRTIPRKGAPQLGVFSFASRRSATSSIMLDPNGHDPILKFVAYNLSGKTLTIVFKIGSGLKRAHGALTCFPFGRGEYGVPRSAGSTRCLYIADLQEDETYEFKAGGESWESAQQRFLPLSD